MTKFNPATAADTAFVPNQHDIEVWKPFFQEAGRAVIARLLDFELAWVSVDPDVVSNDPFTIAEGFNSGHQCMSNFDVYINPIIKKQGALSKHDKKTVIDYCSVILTEPYVGWFMGPHGLDGIRSSGTREKVKMILGLVEPNLLARGKLFDAAGYQTRKLVTKNWFGIAEVSQALFDRRTLTGKEIDDLLKLDIARAA